MKTNMLISPAIAFFFMLIVPALTLAHDDEHKVKGNHGSFDQYEEGSGMKTNSKHLDTSQKHGNNEIHENSSKHLKEGSNMKVNEKKHADHQEHGEYKRHEKPSDHMGEGSGMR